MYTWEIKDYLERQNYNLNDYLKDFHEKIFKNSPQIKTVRFEGIYGNQSKYYLEVDNFNCYFWVKNKMA